MTPLIEQIVRYGQAMADTHNESKTYNVRAASKDLAEEMLKVIRMRVAQLETGR